VNKKIVSKFVPQSNCHNMKNPFFDRNWKHGFYLDKWIRIHQPRKKYNVLFWDEIIDEYEHVLGEFKELLNSQEQVFDSAGNVLTPQDLYNLIDQYQIRIDKLALIFKLRLYKTLNENKKSGVKYIVMRAFWIDRYGKNVRWFSKNMGAESKVLVNGTIPSNQLASIEKEMLLLMWDQYCVEYLGADGLISYDDGNVVTL
jgi:hypothetical protein